jgi:hypothetical protein
MEYNIYCDESCHLQKSEDKVMVLGAVSCSREKRREIARCIREIKIRHGFSPSFEIKMNKISPSKSQFYLDLLNYFFDNDELRFRALVIPDKTALRHDEFGQTHDKFYYKMFFSLLKSLFDPKNTYWVYIDRKDTHSGEKVRELHNVLCNNNYDFQRSIIQNIQPILSHESELMQLCDFLTGLIAYINRGLSGNAAKVTLVECMKRRSGYSLVRTTLLREHKTNIFIWHAQEDGQ